MTKTAFVLTGEGAKGAWQAGAILALNRRFGVMPHALYGVSSGAVNSIGYALAGPVELYEIWRNVSGLKSVFAFNKFSFLWSTGFFNSKPIRKVLSKFTNKKFICDVSIPAVDAISGELRWTEFKTGNGYPHDEIDKAFAAAIAIPGLVEASSGMIDGGCRILAPLRRAIDDGADAIYIITGRPMDKMPVFDGKGFGIGGIFLKAPLYAYRFLDLLMHQIMIKDLEIAQTVNRLGWKPNKNSEVKPTRCVQIFLVSPSDHIGGALEFNKCPEIVLKGLNEARIKDVTV